MQFRGRIILLVIIVAGSGFGIFYAANALTLHSLFIKITGDHTDNGYMCYVSKSQFGIVTTIGFVKDSQVNIKFKNSDKSTGAPIDFNLDEFNIHTQPLGYFQEQSFNFVADKAGRFEINSTLHPDMKCYIDVFDPQSRKSTVVTNPLD